MPTPLSLIRCLPGVIALLAAHPLVASPVSHPDRPDRLVEARDGISVEYAPGDEVWVEAAFIEIAHHNDRITALTPLSPDPDSIIVPGSARDLRQRRDIFLQAIAHHVGLAEPTELQGRSFDTFLGYYELYDVANRQGANLLLARGTVHHVEIWQRDDLVNRLRAGQSIPGMSYDAATDRGNYNLNFDTPLVGLEIEAIQDSIDAQRLDHKLNYETHDGIASFSARVTIGSPPSPLKRTDQTTPIEIPELTVPIIYRTRAEAGVTIDPDQIRQPLRYLADGIEQIQHSARTYRNPTLVGIILHETAETGLVEKVIGSADRRWLCDGTANYVSWRVARDLIDAGFAQATYDLDAQLNLYAANQSQIHLTKWKAVEQQDETASSTTLNRAHYAFAARAIFLLTQQHGDDALAQLWADVAKTPRAKVTAKTFATAYRQRFGQKLDKLLQQAERTPLPPPATAPTPTSAPVANR